jgi:hypothetical protein
MLALCNNVGLGGDVMIARVAFAALFALLKISSAASAASDDSARAMFGPTPHSAWALSVCGNDKFYDARSSNAPAPVAAALAGAGHNLTFRTCTDSDGNAHYFVRDLWRSPSDVCRVYDGEVFLGRKPDDSIVADSSDGGKVTYLTGWTYAAPDSWHEVGYDRVLTQFALIVDPAAPCPSVSDSHYIRVVATDGMLKGIVRLWHDATISQAAFDRAFGAVKVRDDYPPRTPDSERELLRRWIFEEHATIEMIDCTRRISNGVGCAANIGVLTIEFDVGDTGRLEIISIGDNLEPVW